MFSNNRVQWIEDNKSLIKLFFNINKLSYSTKKKCDFDFISSGLKFAVQYENKEKNNINEIDKKIKFYENEVKFFEKKLKNQSFLDKAPLKIVNENKAKLKDALKNLNLLKK